MYGALSPSFGAFERFPKRMAPEVWQDVLPTSTSRYSSLSAASRLGVGTTGMTCQ